VVPMLAGGPEDRTAGVPRVGIELRELPDGGPEVLGGLDDIIHDVSSLLPLV